MSVDVTVNGQTAPANRVKALNIDDATADVWGFINGGCAVVGVVAGITAGRREQGGFLLEQEQHDVL